MDLQQTRHAIDFVVQRVRSGRLALPDFQRDFVWTPSQVVELLDSVSKQWPIGSLLLLTGPQPFAFRPIDNAPSINRSELDLYILDGQQRVTALYHAINDVSDYCYFIDFNALLEGDDYVRYERRLRFSQQYADTKTRALAGIALIRDIWEPSSFFEWIKFVSDEAKRADYLRLRETKIAGLQSRVYQLMAIELDQGIDLEALARIFETTNRTGVALDAFDLLVAKLYPHSFNLRNSWADAIEKHAILRHFAPNEIEILKLVALIARSRVGGRLARGVRQGDLLALDPSLIINHWGEGVDLYASALRLCVKFGVVTRDLIPNWSMVLGAAGCILYLTPDEYYEWWLSRLLDQTFAQAANTKIVAEFDNRMRSRPGPAERDLKSILSRPARANGLLTRGLVALYVRNGARDPLTNESLSQAVGIELRTIDNGVIRKLVPDDTIGQVIAMDVRTAVTGSIEKHPMNRASLASQGVSWKTFRRDVDALKTVIPSLGVSL